MEEKRPRGPATYATPVGSALQLLPRIEPHEKRRVLLASLSFVCIAAGALVARAGGDAIFLSYFGSALLPRMYIIGAIATSIGTFACIRASRRLRTGHIAIAVAALVLLGNVALFLSFRVFPSVSRGAAYLLADITTRIPVFLFWAFASEIFDARQSRRLFGVIGSAGTAACLPTGLLIGPFARRAGAESLVLVAAALMCGFIASAYALMREHKETLTLRRGLASGGRASARGAMATPQLASIAALAVVTSVVETLVDFQFKSTAATMFSSTSLANVFGTLYAICSVASLFIQLLLVHRLLAAAGVFASLAVLPSALLLGQAGIFRFAGASWVFVTKALDITLTTTVNGTARQLLYRGVRSESRLTARALADGLYLPLAIGLAGSGLAMLKGSISIQGAAAVGAAGCVLWLILARVAHSAYVSGLIDSLKARQFGFAEETFSSRNRALDAWVREAFASASDDNLIYLATLLPQLGQSVRKEQLIAALARDNPRVKVAVLQALGGADIPEGPALARSLAHHTDPEVRRAAILAGAEPTASLADLEWLEHALSDRAPRVRAAAAAGFANAAGAEARALGRERLEKMATSENPEFRAAAAEAFEHVNDGSGEERELRTKLLVRFLDDRHASVVLAALQTIRSTRDAALVRPVLSLLGVPVLAGPASDALADIGSPVIDAVLPLADDPVRYNAILANVPPIVARIADPRGLAIIRKLMTPRPPEERAPVFRAYVQLLEREHAVDAHIAEIDGLVEEECRAAFARLTTMRRLGDDPAVRLARDAVSDLASCHIQNAFILLDARATDVDMTVLHRQITSGTADERSNAIELIENVLPNNLRDLILSLLDPRATDVQPAPESAIAELLADRDSEWIIAGAAWAAAELAIASCVSRLEALKDHVSAVVRETAIVALHRIEVAR